MAEQRGGRQGSLSLLGRASSGPHVELIGNREAVVEGCQGILEYDEGRDGLNAELPCKILVLIDVALADLRAFKSLCGLLEYP